MSKNYRNPAQRAKRNIKRAAKNKAWYKTMMERPCHYCNKQADTRDHVVPIAKGGRTTQDNMVPACKKCNSDKADKTSACSCAFCVTARATYQEVLCG